MSDIQARDIHLVEVRGVYEDKERICVVVAVDGDKVTIVYGQSTDGPGRSICVDMKSPYVKRFKIKKTTYFRDSNVTIVDRKAVGKRLGTCSQAQFPDFVEFVERFFRRHGSQQRHEAAAPASASTRPAANDSALSATPARSGDEPADGDSTDP